MALTVAEKSCAFGSTTWVVAALMPLATDSRWTSTARPLPYSLLSLMNATLLGFTVCDRYDAMPLACRASSAITRWNTVSGETIVGSLTLVADGLMNTRPASWYSGIRALVSPEKAGPTVPMTLLSWMNCGATVVAWAGSPPVSNSLRAIVGPSFLAFSSSMATLMPSRMLMPRLALSPVLAPTKPMYTVLPVLALVDDFLLFPQAAKPTASTARTATTRSARALA